MSDFFSPAAMITITTSDALAHKLNVPHDHVLLAAMAALGQRNLAHILPEYEGVYGLTGPLADEITKILND